MNITELFYTSAQRFPKETAIIFKDQQITYEELAQQVQETAAWFNHKGIQRGDRVLIFVPMSIDLYRCVLALFHIGATAVFLDEWVSKKRMELCCQIANCQAFIGICKARVFAYFSPELRRIPIKLGTSYQTKGLRIARMVETTPEETALITFTTGSTGTPKAAKRTHGFLEKQFGKLIEKIDPQVGDIDMPVLPIVLLCNLGLGATSVIADFKAAKPASFKPAKVLRQIQQHKVNRMTASPFFLKKLSQFLIEEKKCLSQIQKIFTGGAAVFPEEAELYIAAFPYAVIHIVYGSTEAEPISAIEAKDLIKEKGKVLTQGLKVGIPETPTKIIRIEDGEIECANMEALATYQVATTEIGEIIVSGAHVLRAYYNNPAALKRNKISIGDQVWHRTGDGGYLDADGTLFLTGRCKQMIPHASGYLAPFLYEYFFQTLSGVSMGTILSYQEEVVIALETDKQANRTEIEEAIKQLKIGTTAIRFVKKIPRDPRHHSKIDYDQLVAQLKT